ncbi:hypothetical protein SO802_002925 [Lithocarpus litseifolius]|uniref:RNase H type-1 domain-containing protein n=1 Tax=Lithocarpus litseifolius TaxID=425828 RepID=A0AAW2E3Z5_9ROSI
MEIMTQGTSQDLEFFFVTAWSIWYSRNQVVHESVCQSPNQIWSFARTYLKDYKEAVSPLSLLRSHEGNRWVAPPAACSRYLSGQFTTSEVEVLAVECGILFAQELELSQVIIESDALSMVQSIIDNETDGSLGHFYSGISQVLELFSK